MGDESACEMETHLLKYRDGPLSVVARKSAVEYVELARVDVCSRVRLADLKSDPGEDTDALDESRSHPCQAPKRPE